MSLKNLFQYSALSISYVLCCLPIIIHQKHDVVFSLVQRHGRQVPGEKDEPPSLHPLFVGYPDLLGDKKQREQRLAP